MSGGVVRALTAALLVFSGYVRLGLAVSHGPPRLLDLSGEAFAGHGLPAAAFLSSAGLFPVYATLCVAAIVAGLVRRAWLRTAAIAVVALVVAWRVSDAFKAFFGRPRPERWFVHHETSFSYASGHATLALTFYGFWAFVAWQSGLPVGVRRAIVAVLGLWILGIGWSRLALGAHYVSDVLGGYVLGAGVLLLAILTLVVSGERADRHLAAGTARRLDKSRRDRYGGSPCDEARGTLV